MTSNKTIRYLLLFVLGLLTSCSNTKFLKEGQQLYTGAEVEILSDSMSKSEKKILQKELETHLYPKPNSSFLGLRPKLYLYNTTKEPKKQKGFRYWKKYKLGEPPVLLSDVDRVFNQNNLESYAENKGYFNAESFSEVIDNNKRAKIKYSITPKSRYVIDQVIYPEDSLEISKEIYALKENSLLKKGDFFDLDVIVSERNRIDLQLKEKGYYYFHPDNLIIQADSTKNKNKVDLYVKLKNNTPKLATKKFYINTTKVLADYKLGKRRDNVKTTFDTINHQKEILVLDPENKFKPTIYDRVLYFQKGDVYQRSKHNLTLGRLTGLGVFKFVKNQFLVSDSTKNEFDVYYYLTPNEFKSLRAEILGKTNSANYVGSEVNINWNHRNFLKGAEIFRAEIFGSFDYQMGGNKDNTIANNIYRVGSNISLIWPRIIAPFHFSSSSGFVPRTRVKLGYEYLNRTQLYTLHNFNAAFGYIWKENAQREHELNILDITYVSPEKITDLYRQQMQGNKALSRVVEKQLIFGPTYSYTFTNTMLPRKNTFYYNGKADFSANLTGLLWNANAEKNRQREILGVPFSQYLKIENDFRYFRKITDNSTLATRLFLGVAYPYGNSQYMPFSRQFFAGGSNSIRSFRARTLGPGSYDPRGNNTIFLHDQSGDIKLEYNLEYRTKIFGFVNGAAFVDAGNIWLFNEDAEKPGGKISKDFISEVAVGAGLGLRFDFSILILRTDLAIPLRVPYYDKADRWRFNHINLRDKYWRRENMILNIAIGYPF